MEVKDLVEATSVDDIDWIYIQKPNGLSRKIKKSNLISTQQQSIQIITSATPPSNPQAGMIWNELDAGNNLLQQWNYLSLLGNLTWVSSVFNFSLPVTSLAQQNRISLQSRFNCFIKQVNILFRTNGGALSASQWLDKKLTFGDPQTIHDTNYLLASVRYTNLPQSREVASLIEVNKLVMPTSETITLSLNGKGTNKYSFGFHTETSSGVNSANYSSFESVSYQLVRK